jgi:hypothetical protein
VSWLGILGVVWALSMAAAVIAVWRYKATPGRAAAAAPLTWPSDLALPRAAGRATIVMLAHPRCTCTRASLDELALLMTQLGDRASGYVLFMRPTDLPEGWERGDSWTRARAIPGVQVMTDRDGALAARFGATTSGHTVVYDAQGRLVFSGGITGARGHEGDNAGLAMIRTQLARRSLEVGNTPTYGCELGLIRGDHR